MIRLAFQVPSTMELARAETEGFDGLGRKQDLNAPILEMNMLPQSSKLIC